MNEVNLRIISVACALGMLSGLFLESQEMGFGDDEFIVISKGDVYSEDEEGYFEIEDSTTLFFAKHPVTWKKWQRIQEWAVNNGYDIGDVGDGCGETYPVHSVNWYDVVKWMNARSEMEGLIPVYYSDVGLKNVYRDGNIDLDERHLNQTANGYRLPKEHEWEFVARGGNKTIILKYSGSDDPHEVAWFWENSVDSDCPMGIEGRGTWPVGTKNPNELGAYDMSGNLWEWCWDPWELTITPQRRVLRGGSWESARSNITVSSRFLEEPAERREVIGFRAVRVSKD